MFDSILDTITNFLENTGIAQLFAHENWWQYAIMYVIAFVLIYLAIAKQFEPLLLLPIAIGMLLTNLPGANLFHLDMWMDPDMKVSQSIVEVINKGGFLDLLYIGVKLGIYPCIIFMGIGAMTDFTPLIANPKYFLIGAGAQTGVFVAFSAALLTGAYTIGEAASIGIIGGADGPTAILVTKTLGPAILGAVAIAAYSYMALIPMIQPPFMKMLTTKKERLIKMEKLRPVSRIEKLVFPILVTVVVGLVVPDALSLIGCLMFGNILNVCGVTERLSKTVQNEFMNIITILLGISVGATASAENFLSIQTVIIVVCGLIAFCISTCGGLITAKIMNWISGGKINPLIGSAGVSAVPMAARVSQTVGQKEDPSNFLLMHAMGPNVAGVIGSAVAAGVFLSWIG
jgi:oxaloacetate decarboxylase beta subunit